MNLFRRLKRIFASLQKADPRRTGLTPPSRDAVSRVIAPLTRAGSRLLQSLSGRFVVTFGKPCDAAPAEVHRTFHRGGKIVCVNRSAHGAFSVEWIL